MFTRRCISKFKWIILTLSFTHGLSYADKLLYAYNDSHEGITSHHIHLKDLETNEVKLLTGNNGAAWNATFSPNGDWIVYSLFLNGKAQIYKVNIDGHERKQLTDFDDFIAFHPMVSPDGSTIAFSHWGQKSIALIDVNGGNLKHLTDHSERDYHPVFFNDGNRILFGSYRMKSELGEPGIFIYSLKDKSIKHTGFYGKYARPSFSGKSIVFSSKNDSDVEQIYVATLDTTQANLKGGAQSQLVRLTHGKYYHGHPTFTHDDKRIVFVSRKDQERSFPKAQESDIAGTNEVYVMDIDGKNMKRLSVSEGVAWHPEIYTTH